MQYLNVVLLAAAAMASEVPVYGQPAPVYSSAIDTTCTEEVVKPTAPVYESKTPEVPVYTTKSHEIPVYSTKSAEVPVYTTKSAEIPVYSTKSAEVPVYSTKSVEIPVYSSKPEVPVYTKTSSYHTLPVETQTGAPPVYNTWKTETAPGTWYPAPSVYTCPPAVTVTVTVPGSPQQPPAYPTVSVPGGATIQTSVPVYQPTGPVQPPVYQPSTYTPLPVETPGGPSPPTYQPTGPAQPPSYTPLPVETPGGPSPPTYPSGTPVQPPVYGTGYPAPSGTGKAPHYPSYTGAAVAINRGAAATGAGVMGAIAAFFML